jgi:hypothetical protein
MVFACPDFWLFYYIMYEMFYGSCRGSVMVIVIMHNVIRAGGGKVIPT